MNTNVIIIGVAAVAGVLTKMSSDSDAAKMAANIRATARSQASTNANWADEFSISMKRNDALGKLRRFESQERSRIEKAFNDNAEAKTAVKEFNKLNRQYEEAKKAVDNFKPSEVSVSVGSGENSAAVKISDESAKAALDAKLADISAKRKDAKDAVDEIRKMISETVKDERPIEHTDAIDNFKHLDDELKLAKGSNERSVESLLNDKDWTHKEFVKEFQKTHTQAGIIAKGCLYSALPVAALVLIWKGTFSELAILKEVV